MIEFFRNHTEELVWILLVIVTAALLIGITRLFFWLLLRKFDDDNSGPANTLRLLKKIISAFLYLAAILLISYVFFEENMYDFVTQNLKRVTWGFFVAIVTIIAAAAVQSAFDRLIARAELTDGEDPTSFRFFNYAAVTSIYVLGFVLGALAIPGLKTVAQSALAGAGILAVIAGVASQEALANIVGGVLVVVFRPFKLDDTVKIGDTLIGTVEDITLRHTVIRNYKNKRIVVPNSVINKEIVVNYDMVEKLICQWVEVGISYGSDVRLAKEIMRQVCEDHPLSLDVRTRIQRTNHEDSVAVRVLSLDDSAVTLRAWVWAADYRSSFLMTCELLEQIKAAFEEQGIEIPFPHRTLFLHSGSKNNDLAGELATTPNA